MDLWKWLHFDEMFLSRCQEIITLSFHALDIKRTLLDHIQLFQNQYSQHDTDSSQHDSSSSDPFASLRSSIVYGMLDDTITHYEEHNIGDYLWNVSHTSFGGSVSQMSVDDDRVDVTKRKAMGLTPSLFAVLKQFDSQLTDIMSDINHLVQPTNAKNRYCREDVCLTSAAPPRVS